jgi:signal transduction histidine kinase
LSEEVTPAEDYQREAIGAFAHDIRTPLTSIRMVMELAKSGPNGEEMSLDGELAGMLRASVDELIRLADDLQEMSWLERGKVAVGNGPGNLRTAFQEAVARLAGSVTVTGDEPPSTVGPWNEGRLAGVIEAVAFAANRCGEGLGTIECLAETGDGGVRLVFTSGELTGDRRVVDADLGFGFFRAYAMVRRMGGRVDVDRREHSARLTVFLPR